MRVQGFLIRELMFDGRARKLLIQLFKSSTNILPSSGDVERRTPKTHKILYIKKNARFT